MASRDKYVMMTDTCDDEVAVRTQRCSSKCTKLTVAVLAVLLIIAVVAFAALAVHTLTSLGSGQHQSGGTAELCTSLPCLQLSVRLLSSVNESVDPCDDFYNFSCGNWDEVVDIPPGMWLMQRVTIL